MTPSNRRIGELIRNGANLAYQYYRTGTVKLTARRNIKDKEADSPSLVGHPIVFLKLLRERSSPLSRWQILTSSLLDNLPLNINVALVGSANR